MPVTFESPSTSKVNAGPTELIPTLVVGIPMTFIIVAPIPTCNNEDVVIPATYAFAAVAKPSVAIPDIFRFRAFTSSKVISPPMSTLPLKYALPVTVNAPPTVAAPLTFTSLLKIVAPVIVVAPPTAISFSNLENSANLDAPVTVNAAPTVAAAPTFKS